MNYALYFSRAPFPSLVRNPGMHSVPKWIHIGLYGFRRAFLVPICGSACVPVGAAEKFRAAAGPGTWLFNQGGRGGSKDLCRETGRKT